jgi:TBC1 domain family member 20
MAPGLQSSIESPKEELDGHSEDFVVDRKTDRIVDACNKQDFAALRALAESRGGFLTDTLRQRACKFALKAEHAA